jgi:hypothetical protein
MRVAELVLDYVRALIWPALIAVGVFWLFRSQLGSLLAERRVKSVEAVGVKVELEQVAEVLQENLQESREEVAKAQDPEQRQRAADKLQREAAALGQVKAYQTIRPTLRREASVDRLGPVLADYVRRAIAALQTG